jgi:hypothetical protein
LFPKMGVFVWLILGLVRKGLWLTNRTTMWEPLFICLKRV